MELQKAHAGAQRTREFTRHTKVTMTSTADSGNCHIIRQTFDRLGDKWTLLVIRILGTGPQRFTTLKAAADGISQRMLTLTLRRLQRDGLVERTAYAEVPPRVEYNLTPLGHTLLPPVAALADWALAHEAELRAHQERFDSADQS